MNVLVAEDDATTRRILQRAVEMCGHRCLAARDGLEAWDLFQQGGTDVILSDWLMPGIDGVELCRRVRADAPRTPPYTYVIILTALGDRDHMHAAMEVGADDYLIKPFNHEDLQVRLAVADRVTTVYRRMAVQHRELERSNAELKQFAHIASHDLRTPLSSITGFAELLQERYCGQLDATADRYINFITAGVARMQALIDALLAYTRMDSQAKPFAHVSCAAVVQGALANLHAPLEEAGATVTVEELPMVLGDAVQLGQLVQNLVSNAVKFRHPDRVPTVRVWAEREDAGWVFGVQDNGIGIDPVHAARIFTMFGRLHTREEYEGTGVGLAVCQKIVERHGGRIWVESEPNAGASFRFTLPDG